MPATISFGRPTLDQVLTHIDRVSRDLELPGPVTFHWPATRLDNLVRHHRIIVLCESHQILNFNYNYATETVSFDTMVERNLHEQVQLGINQLLESAIRSLAATVDNEEMRGRLRTVARTGIAGVVQPGRLRTEPDIAFRERLMLSPPLPPPILPSLVGEIC